MKKIRTFHFLFSLALICTLGLALTPTASAHALSADSFTGPMFAENQANTPALSTAGALVCKSIVVWRHGHRFVIRKCHKADNPSV